MFTKFENHSKSSTPLTTQPDGDLMSNYIRQNEINTANQPPQVELPLLESSCGMDKLPCITDTEDSPETKL